MGSSQHYRSPFGDTTYTKIFVGGLAWETQTDVMRRYFEQFGDILEAVIITDKNTAKSKGYGFVTFRDPESARSACVEANPVIDGRRANCNIASLGRPRPSPPRGRNQRANINNEGVAGSVPPFPTPAPLIYPHAAYGYTSFSPGYGYHQTIYNHPQLEQQQYYPQVYGATTTSSGMGNPYYYGGYSMQALSPRVGSFSFATQTQRFHGVPSYLYYPLPTTQMEGSFSYPPSSPLPVLLQNPTTTTTNNTSTESQTHHQSTEVGATTTSSVDTPNT